MHKVSFILLVIGGLNWLVLAIFNWDIGMLFGGQGETISKLIYILVGLAALYEIFTHKARCKGCDKAMAPAGGVKTGM
ncbi:MAG TPA: DUF378 domain-containing protein [Candidatus Paceibacterota bacterium]